MFRAGRRFFQNIHRSASAEESVEVSESNGVRSLHLGNDTIQSSMRLLDPTALELAYTRGMMVFMLFMQNMKDIVIIGLGGGSVPKYIYHHLPEVDSLRVVEINPRIIQFARSHFEVPDNDARFEIIEGDGAAYVKAHPATTQVLIMDAYGGSGIAEELSSQEFFDNCARALTPDGVLVANLWGSDPNFGVYLQRIEQAFDHRVFMLPTGRPGNIIVFAFRRQPLELRWTVLREKAKALEKTHKIEFLQFLEKIRDCNPATSHRLIFESRA